MKITRNNYEEYFLLYVDGELNSSQRRTVEDFIADNPDLKVELDMLLESVLPPVEISFDKSSLHKSPSEYQPSDERILPFIDHELPASQVAAFEKEVSSNPMLKAEVDLLMQTKLDAAEHISFGNKQRLYRRERGRLVAMRFVRIAVAAALLALLLTAVWVYLGNKPANNVARNVFPAQKEKQQISNNRAGQVDKQSAGNPEEIAQNQKASPVTEQPDAHRKMLAVEGNEKNQQRNQFSVRSVSNTHKINADPGRSSETETAMQKKSSDVRNKSNNLPVPLKENRPVFVNQAPDELMAAAPKEELKIRDLPMKDNYNKQIIDNNHYAQMAVMRDENENNNSIFYVPEDEVAKTKVGGIFKKVKRVISGNANIKTANSVTIGGFQVAIK